ncbi:MAG: hypothetical protein AB3N33_02605 [Puniceicoccaceae bacterium]
MKGKFITICTIALLGCLFSGCSSLESPHVVGEPVVFDGKHVGDVLTCQVGETPLLLKVTDSTHLRAAWPEWDQANDTFQLAGAEIVVSRLGKDILLANIKEDNSENYSIFLLSLVYGGEGPQGFKAVGFTVDDDAMDRLASIETNRIGVHGSYGSTFVLEGNKEDADAFVATYSKEMFLYSLGFEITQLSGENILENLL